MNYTPNFSDPRVQRRIKLALEFCQTAFDSQTPRSWSTRYIDRYFGQIHKPLSQWLRRQLLICTDHHWNMEIGKCKQYIKNPSGIAYVRSCLKSQTSEWSVSCFEQEITTGQFEYLDQSQRLWHPLQRVPSEQRRPLMAQYGYHYEYDLKACAPNLLVQYARRLGLSQPTPQIDHYIQDRTAIRNLLAEQLGVEPAKIKKIITALFAGAPLSHYPDTEIYRLVNGNHMQIDILKQVLFELRKEIKMIWDTIKVHITRSYITDKRGKVRLKSLTCGDKWSIYFQLEREVMDSIRSYMKKTKNKFFNEHDGWRCVNVIDEVMLISYVRNQTGYVIDLDMTICSL